MRIAPSLPLSALAIGFLCFACSPAPAPAPPSIPAPATAPAPISAPAPASVAQAGVQPAVSGARYRVVGTEPFWGVQVDGDGLLFTTVEDQAGKALQAAPMPRPDGVRYAGSDGTTDFELDLQRGTCSDGMSDRTYAYKARFRFGGIDHVGCADEVR